MLLNEKTLNTQAFNWWNKSMYVDYSDFAIAWLSLNSENIKIISIQETTSNQLNSFDVPNNFWKGFLSYYDRGRTLSLEIFVKWKDKQEFQKNFDELRKFFYKPWNLFFKKVGWIYRTLKIYPILIPIEQNHFEINCKKVTVQVQTLQPFWSETNYKTKSFLNQTSSFNTEIMNEWSAISEPKIYLFFKKAENVEFIQIKIWEKFIKINKKIQSKDIVIVDCQEKEITINQVQVDYIGSFPQLQSWINYITVDIDGTYNVDNNVLYIKNRI